MVISAEQNYCLRLSIEFLTSLTSVWALEEDGKADVCSYISRNRAIIFSRAIIVVSIYLDMCMVV